ncbi:MAG TPA: BrnT family toxin [Bryobacteraceae bacterium]|nr:BrnT family toxin [Bryobacteraceae bacterium]
MEFEWHDTKRRTNLVLHGIDFEDAIGIWEGPVLEVASTQLQHGEERFLAVGRCEGRIITVVFTWRGKTRRLISARAARRYERENYEKIVERQTQG